MKAITLQSKKWEVIGRLREEALFLSRGAQSGQWVAARRMLAEGKPRAELVRAGICVEAPASQARAS